MTQTTTTTSSGSYPVADAPASTAVVTDDAILVGVWSTPIPTGPRAKFTATPGTAGALVVQFSRDSGATWASTAPITGTFSAEIPSEVTSVRATASGSTGILSVSTPTDRTFVDLPGNSSNGAASLNGAALQAVVTGAYYATVYADKLTGPGVEVVVRTAAMSTTVGVQYRPVKGIWRTLRISSVNISANAATQLFATLNYADDLEALYWSQTVQRDAALTIGGVALIRSPVPITSVFISSDLAVALSAHRLTLSFGV